MCPCTMIGGSRAWRKAPGAGCLKPSAATRTSTFQILTRSPLAWEDFDIFQSFGDRLLLGTSLPTLDPSDQSHLRAQGLGHATSSQATHRGTRRGTPGYGTLLWYAGGHPDIYGVAATFYNLLTGNMPDRMGRAAAG